MMKKSGVGKGLLGIQFLALEQVYFVCIASLSENKIEQTVNKSRFISEKTILLHIGHLLVPLRHSPC